MSNYTLLDDGTLDTVFLCDTCRQEIRYSSDALERNEHGYLSPESVEQVASDHEWECPGEQPQEDDYIIGLTGLLLGLYTVKLSNGRIMESTEWDTILDAIRADMEETGYFPSVFFVNCHGNTDIVSM